MPAKNNRLHQRKAIEDQDAAAAVQLAKRPKATMAEMAHSHGPAEGLNGAIPNGAAPDESAS